jgi:prefoldin subunit 5
MQDGTRCDFFQWQANYAIRLIREGFATNTDRVIDTIAIAIIDHCRALESHTTSIRNNKEKLVKLEGGMKQEVVVLKQELDSLKAAMAQNEAMNQEVEVLKRELNNLKSAANKPRIFSLGLLLLVILIAWFLMRLENGEAFRRGFMLSP